jgi:hypothetical protein
VRETFVEQGLMRIAAACYFAMATTLPLGVNLAEAQERFQRLQDHEISTMLAGNEVTDDVHWAYQYMRDGSLKAVSMGSMTTGKWYVENGQLCIEDGTPDSGCWEVWMLEDEIELREAGGGFVLQGVLQEQQLRQ